MPNLCIILLIDLTIKVCQYKSKFMGHWVEGIARSSNVKAVGDLGFLCIFPK